MSKRLRELSGQVIEAIDKFRVFTSWVTNTCRVADFLSFFDSQTWADKQNGSVQMLREQLACHPFIQVLKQRNEDIWCWRWRKRRSGDTEKCLWSCIAGYCASICCWDKTRTWWNHDCLISAFQNTPQSRYLSTKVCQTSQIPKIVILIVWLPLFKHGLQMPSGQELCEWEWQTSGARLPATSCSSVMLNSNDLKGFRIEFGIIWRWTKS